MGHQVRCSHQHRVQHYLQLVGCLGSLITTRRWSKIWLPHRQKQFETHSPPPHNKQRARKSASPPHFNSSNLHRHVSFLPLGIAFFFRTTTPSLLSLSRPLAPSIILNCSRFA